MVLTMKLQYAYNNCIFARKYEVYKDKKCVENRNLEIET